MYSSRRVLPAAMVTSPCMSLQWHVTSIRIMKTFEEGASAVENTIRVHSREWSKITTSLHTVCCFYSPEITTLLFVGKWSWCLVGRAWWPLLPTIAYTACISCELPCFLLKCMVKKEIVVRDTARLGVTLLCLYNMKESCWCDKALCYYVQWYHSYVFGSVAN